MKMNTFSTKARNSNRIAPFNTLKIAGNSLVLINKKEEEFTILFSELDKIYIKRRQFSFFFKVGITVASLFMISIVANYLLIEIVPAALLFFMPLFVWMNNYRWYQLNVLINDGNFFRKTFYKEKKQEQIILLNVVRKEIYNNHTRSDFRDEKRTDVNLVETNNSFPTLSIV